MTVLDPAPTWGSFDELAATANACTKCPLAETRTQVVFGVGNPNADLVFVGEGPGAEEDRQGIPFVGRAGQLLTRLI
jgi:uracil-DNA glycosylase family 4